MLRHRVSPPASPMTRLQRSIQYAATSSSFANFAMAMGWMDTALLACSVMRAKSLDLRLISARSLRFEPNPIAALERAEQRQAAKSSGRAPS
jgi:hypothetical protein